MYDCLDELHLVKNCSWEIKSITKFLLCYICCVPEHASFSGTATLALTVKINKKENWKKKSKQNYCASCTVTLKLYYIVVCQSASQTPNVWLTLKIF